MKAIKKRIERKYSITTEDTLVVTAKDNTQRLAKAGDVIITEDDGSQYSMSRETFDKNMIFKMRILVYQKQMKLILF